MGRVFAISIGVLGSLVGGRAELTLSTLLSSPINCFLLHALERDVLIPPVLLSAGHGRGGTCSVQRKSLIRLFPPRGRKLLWLHYPLTGTPHSVLLLVGREGGGL